MDFCSENCIDKVPWGYLRPLKCTSVNRPQTGGTLKYAHKPTFKATLKYQPHFTNISLSVIC